MTLEEQFNKDVWFVLRQISAKLLYTKQGHPIEYEVKYYGNEDLYKETASSPEHEEAVLEKLAEWRAISISEKEEAPSPFHIQAVFYSIEILQTKFDEIYQKYKNACDHESYIDSTVQPQIKKILEEPKSKNNTQILADKLNKDFAEDKQSI